MIAGVMSGDMETQLAATSRFRKILSKERNPPIAEVIACGVIPKFVSFLTYPHPALQVGASGVTTPCARRESQIVVS